MKSLDLPRGNRETSEEEQRYHLRSRIVTSNIREVNMADENCSNSGDETDCTIMQQDSTLADLREQIKMLQKSLAAAEQDKLCLKEKMNRQSIDVNAAEATTASFKNVEPTIPSPIVTSRSTAVASSCLETNLSAASDLTSATSAHERAIVTFAGVNYANATSVNATGLYPVYGNYTTNYSPMQSSQNFATAHQSTGFPSINRSATTSTVSTSNLPHVYMPNVSAASVMNGTHPTWTPGCYSQTQTRKILDLPEFHGSPEEWPMFSVAFKETTNMYFYTNVENLLRLQKALKGRARQQVESLLIHPNSVEAAMKTLEFHYGRPELLIRSQIAKVRSFPAVTGGRITEILNLSAIVSNLTAFLENSGAIPHLNNPTLLEELVCKLAVNKREEWYRHIFTLQIPYPTVRDFCNWLQQIATYVSMCIDVMPPKNAGNEQVSNKVKASSKPVMTAINIENMCAMSKQSHQLYQCHKFKDIDYASRWNFVKINRLCFCCLFVFIMQ
ncbi:uncharacterized protein LOC118749361 [Rhagoletis pomonella]|uniref:uncharacterized protein LOC118749361 n=1 Tax=Rhagoletis pomonella TaxID=28610 RepID=UPI00178211DE|nr:uncharacterized protein LOC118749361 [Rhagoletis pomonella]